MAEIDYREVNGGIGEMSQHFDKSGKIGKLVNAAGAVMSVALVIGIGVWGYRLLVRDVTGVPIVRALDGPMRTQAEDPGGLKTAHQGLAVNKVQADGGVEGIADRLVLAPVNAGIDQQDHAGLRRPAIRTTPPTESADAENIIQTPAEIAAPALLSQTVPATGLPATVSDGQGAIVTATDATGTKPAPKNDAVTQALALADQISAESQPLGDIVAVAEKAPLALIPASVAGVARSPRPLKRPRSLNTTPASAPVEVAAARTVAASTSTKDVNASSIKAGTRLAQLGAFDSEAVARAEWDKLYSRFTEYLEGKSRVIQKASSGGRTFYRLRAMGFEDISDARRFCSALLAENAACIPVKVR